MTMIKVNIDGQKIEVTAGTTILDASRGAGIYIPSLCNHPDLPPAEEIEAARVVYQGDRKIENATHLTSGKGCGLCLVEIEGEVELVRSCATEAEEGMVIITDSDRIREKRKENLVPILARHRHACLTCAQQEGCSRSQCSSNVPENGRCCSRFGHCELQNVANYVGISPATPKWIPTDLPIFENQPLFVRDYNLCIGCTRCIRACRDLRGIEAIGFVYDENGLVQVGTLAPALVDSGCKFCTACVEVCPTGALMDKSVRPGKKEKDIVPCKEACPAHIDIPAYLRLIAQGKRDEANAVIREKVPFPGILGRVCPHPCEEACRRGEVNEPVSICVLKRYAADGDKGLWKENTKTGADTGKKVAVVGAGPAGMTAAFYLRKQGHAVTVFESRSRAGGMMRYGIPDCRLPFEILEKEIKDVLALGIEFHPNQTLGKDFTLAQLRSDGYDAVFLGVGAQLSLRIPLDGSDLPDVLWGVDFLGRIAEGENIRLKDRVIVIGGGNVAVDAAISAMRCGAKQVNMACLESREEMPAHECEIERAVAEGLGLISSWGPHRIIYENGQVTGMELVGCASVFDVQGKFNPIFDHTKKTIEGDQVILAAGQACDLSFLGHESGVSVDRGLIVVDQKTLETGLKGVYAGGDVTALPGTIIHAIAAGRKAASSIDKALGGTGDIEEVLFERGVPNQHMGRDEEFTLRPREKGAELELEARREGFQEVALGYTDEQAVKEAGRCLQCDLRLYLGANPSPPEKILAFNTEHISAAPEEEGVYQLYDGERNILSIKGTPNLKESLSRELEKNGRAVFFNVDKDKMFSRRESELIQQYVRKHGEMPRGGEDELDDLF
jgi:NADPH-dependent glutamate synthase beta subunit-like oxidoreductase